MSKLAQSIDKYETFQRSSVVLATNSPYDPVVYLNYAQANLLTWRCYPGNKSTNNYHVHCVIIQHYLSLI